MIVAIDCFPSGEDRYFHSYAIVAIDVIRATTTSVTALSAGRRCFPVDSVEAAFQMRERIPNCLLAGEVAGLKPDGFDLNNSPASLAVRSDRHRPVVLLSSSGTKLMVQSSTCEAAYVACLRNYKAVASYIAGRHERVALLGASTRGEFREEDQLCCAWIAADLLQLGYEPENRRTLNLIEQWKATAVHACANGNSAAYLRRSGQVDDLNFVLSHVNDVPRAFRLEEGEILPVRSFPKTGKEEKTAATRSRFAA